MVSKIGHYVSFMISGACIVALGTGLLITISLATPTVQGAAYLVVPSLGIGLGLKIRETDVPIGNGVPVLYGQLAGQWTFLNGLLREVPMPVTGLTTHDIVTAGATDLHKLTTDRETLRRLQIVHAKSGGQHGSGFLSLQRPRPPSVPVEWSGL
ncbi:MAG: hypothetical protein LQ349_003737, partial [Xanthoria aureola]